jgi:hypothetical protein
MPSNAGPFSYTPIRSIYSREERFIQTKKTIETIREKIPDNIILFMECSDLNETEYSYLYENVDIFVNLWTRQIVWIDKTIHNLDQQRREASLAISNIAGQDDGLNYASILKQNIFSKSKSLGEGTITIEALKIILQTEMFEIKFDNLFKISGRYWLKDNFDYEKYNNDKICIKICDSKQIATFIYKINYNNIKTLLKYLESMTTQNSFKMCVSYEEIMKTFIDNRDDIENINILGVSGYISVDGFRIDY